MSPEETTPQEPGEKAPGILARLRGKGTDRKTKATKRARPKKVKKAKKQREESVTGSDTILAETAVPVGKIVAWTVVVLITVGALLGALAFAGGGLNGQREQIAEGEEPDPEEQQVGAYASQYLAAWLSSSREDSRPLAAFDREAVEAESSETYRDLEIASVEDHNEGIFTVTLSASVQRALTVSSTGDPVDESDLDEDDEDDLDTEEIWQSSWYEVTISRTSEGDLSPVGWPAPTSPPTTGVPQTPDYPEAVEDDDLTGQVEGFLQAWATGGENGIELYLHPSSDITRMEPAIYDAASVQEIRADVEPEENPGSGEELQIMVEATMTAEDSDRPTTYFLSLISRDDRWEVSEVGTAPLMEQTEEDEEDSGQNQEGPSDQADDTDLETEESEPSPTDENGEDTTTD